MEFILFSYLPSIVGLYVIALAAYRNNPAHHTNRLFALFTTAISTWLVFLLLADTADKQEQGLWFLRTALAVGTPIGVTFLLFCDVFPRKSKQSLNKKSKLVLWTLTAFLAALSFTPAMVKDVSVSDGGLDIKSVTVLYIVQSTFVAGQMLYGLTQIFKKRHGSTVAERAQIRLFGTGIFVALTFNILSGVVFIAADVGGEVATLTTGMSLLIMASFTWVAVTKQGMFNMRRSIGRAVSYLLSLLLVVCTYALLVAVLVERYAPSEALRILLTATSAVVMIVGFPGFRRWFDRLTSRIFAQHVYSSETEMLQLSKGLVSKLNLPAISIHTLTSIKRVLQPDSATMIVFTDNKTLQYGNRLAEKADLVSKVSLLEQRLTVVDTLNDDISRNFRRAGISLIVPLHSGKGLEGYLMIGQRMSGEFYSDQDVAFMEIVAHHVGLALDSAKNYQKIAGFNKILKQKVLKATKQLRDSNTKLENLHRTKDDFIAMASHQLRPKLTAAGGFIELLQKTDTKMSKEQSELVELTEKSIQQMSAIVKDMLDINRMDDDLANILELKDTQVSDIITKELEMQKADSKKDRIRLITSKTAQNTILRVDSIKLREVVQNIISNALQYSPEDFPVLVKLRTAESEYIFEVRDQGIGMTAAEQKRLFEKFYRSKEAKRVRPTGSGIGLYVSKQIIEAHGGKMHIKSAPKKGSTIGFSLPL